MITKNKVLTGLNQILGATTIALSLLIGGAQADDPYTLQEFRMKLHGPDYLHPSRDSLIGQYLAETKAETVIRSFYRAPEYSAFPPHELGPKRLVVAVSPATFETFKKYFTSKHFFYVLNEHGNHASFEGRMSNPGDIFHAEVMTHELTFLTGPRGTRIATPMILSSSEGDRVHKFFTLSSLDKDLARYPWKIVAKGGVAGIGEKFYSGKGAWATGCSTWLGNIPMGDELVDEYTFPSGDDGQEPVRQKLRPCKTDGFSDEVRKAVLDVWKVPGHKQLGEVLDPGANRRGEFENAGWTGLTFYGSAPAERVPVIFVFVQDASVGIDPNFEFSIEKFGIR